ncbi:MAG: NnrS family protein [Chloroflexota bacterium]|nr:NnrS family protein [Chloroflexota bacterium]
MHIAPYLRASLLLGSGGGFALATVLTLFPLSGIPLGSWWEAIVQTHGHLQLFGWAGLFVVGVALYFLPRLRGTPLARPALLPWILGVQVASLLLRFLSQPFLVATGWLLWKILFILSGVLEALALPAIFLLLLQTVLHKQTAKNALEGVRSIAPFILGAFLSLSLAALLNLLNCVSALSSSGMISATGDEANITLGLFGFLVPVALAMSSRMLPLYAHIQPFPTQLLRILAVAYFGGIIFWLSGIFLPGMLFTFLNAAGFLLIGMVVLIFTGYFLYLLRKRAQISSQVATPNAEMQVKRALQGRREERRRYGPYVGLIGSAYLWGSLGALLLCIDGIASLAFGTLPFTIDAIRHSFAVGFITLLLCGIAVRMIPGFSSKAIRSPRLVTATLILGNLAALLRVGSLLLAPVLPGFEFFFALSGPTGLALVLCLTINLWSAL